MLCDEAAVSREMKLLRNAEAPLSAVEFLYCSGERAEPRGGIFKHTCACGRDRERMGYRRIRIVMLFWPTALSSV